MGFSGEVEGVLIDFYRFIATLRSLLCGVQATWGVEEVPCRFVVELSLQVTFGAIFSDDAFTRGQLTC